MVCQQERGSCLSGNVAFTYLQSTDKAERKWCAECTEFRKSLRDRLIQCENCGRLTRVSSGRQIMLHKAHHVPPDEIENLVECPNCLLASAETRRQNGQERDLRNARRTGYSTVSNLFRNARDLQLAREHVASLRSDGRKRLRAIKFLVPPSLTPDKRYPTVIKTFLRKRQGGMESVTREQCALLRIEPERAEVFDALAASEAPNTQQAVRTLADSKFVDHGHLVRALGNPLILNEHRGELTQRLAHLLQSNPEATGVGTKAHASGPDEGGVSEVPAAPLIEVLASGSPNVVKGALFEVRVLDDMLSSLQGHDKGTQMDIGYHMKHRFASPSPRRSIESDVYFNLRPDPLTSARNYFVGIDAKFRTDGHVSRLEDTQIQRVVELIADNRLHEYHFVTNGVFGETAKEQIRTALESLPPRCRSSMMGRDALRLHEHGHVER